MTPCLLVFLEPASIHTWNMLMSEEHNSKSNTSLLKLSPHETFVEEQKHCNLLCLASKKSPLASASSDVFNTSVQIITSKKQRIIHNHTLNNTRTCIDS